MCDILPMLHAGGEMGRVTPVTLRGGITTENKFQVHTIGDRGSLRKNVQRFIWLTITYVKKCADSIKNSLI